MPPIGLGDFPIYFPKMHALNRRPAAGHDRPVWSNLRAWLRPRRDQEAGTYVRVGSTNRRVDAALIAEMRRFARGEVFDEPPMPEISSEAVSFRAASESFAAVRRLTKRDLQTLQLLTEYPRLVASCCSATTGCNAFQIPGFRLATSTAPIDPRLPITGNSKAPC
jgi:hypothetical protein